MDKPRSVAELTALGRVRLSEHFFMREMLYSEVSNVHGIPNLPDDPDLAVAAGERLCRDVLEPLHRAFGQVSIRSAYRSAALNDFCHRRRTAGDAAYYCGDNDYNAARHIWDRRDAAGYMGATASVLVPWFIERFARTGDARPLAWWIRDHVPAYAELIFFPWLGAFNVRWYEGPSDQAIFFDQPGTPDVLLSRRGEPAFDDDHAAHYPGFPAPG